MNRVLVISFALVFPLVGALSASEQDSRRQPNRPPLIESFTSSSRRVEICPFIRTPVFGLPVVELYVNATDPDGDPLAYKYSVTEGKISGKGTLVSWDLKNLPSGQHKVRVAVTDGKGGKVEADLTVTTVDAGVCDRPPPPCPVIEVTCPAEMNKSKPFSFSVVVRGATRRYRPQFFYWTVNAGRIVKGQNTSRIEANTTGADGFDKITATVDVGGFDPSCSTTNVSCSTKIIW